MPTKVNHIPIFLWLFSTVSFSFCAEKLYVFYPGVTRSHIIQEKLQGALKDFDVYVFGRYSDLVSQVKSNPPVAIIAKQSLIKQLPGYVKAAVGSSSNRHCQTYVLLSIDKKVYFTDLKPSTVIGVVDYLGRKQTELYFKQHLDIECDIKCVLKPEDLIPLLIFDLADCVILEKSIADYFKSIYDLNFLETVLPSSSYEAISLGIQNGSRANKIIADLKNLGVVNVYIFGIDKWE